MINIYMSFLKTGIFGVLKKFLEKEIGSNFGQSFLNGMSEEEIASIELAPEIAIPIIIGQLAISPSGRAFIEHEARKFGQNNRDAGEITRLNPDSQRALARARNRMHNHIPSHLILHPVTGRPRPPAVDPVGDGGPEVKEDTPLLEESRQRGREEQEEKRRKPRKFGDFTGSGPPVNRLSGILNRGSSTMTQKPVDRSGPAPDFGGRVPLETDPFLQQPDPGPSLIRNIMEKRKQIIGLISGGATLSGIIKWIMDTGLTKQNAEDILKDIVKKDPVIKKKLDDNNQKHKINNRIKNILQPGSPVTTGLQKIPMGKFRLPEEGQSYNNVELVRRANANYNLQNNIFQTTF